MSTSQGDAAIPPRSLKVRIEFGGREEPINGQLELPSGDGARFSGWIGLVAAVEAARRAPSHAQVNDVAEEER